MVKGQVLSTAGAYGGALEAMRTGLQIAVEIAHHQWQIDAELMLGALAFDLLAVDPAVEHFRRAHDLAEAIGSLYWLRTAAGFLASALVARGQLETAAALLGEVLEPDTPAVTMGERHAWCARAELALARGEPAEALTILDRIFAASPNVTPGVEHLIPRLALLRATALAALGDARAIPALEAAHATARSRGIPAFEWRILARLAGLYYAQGHRDEAEAARAEAMAVVERLAASLPETALRKQFTAAAAAQMRHIPAPTPLRAAKHAAGGLTAREREVAALIAQGHSNRALADALVLSERTIAKHVENILSKLQFTSRAQIAAWAVERGLARPGGDA
jgi:non-specific serine/threonine protein kinase